MLFHVRRHGRSALKINLFNIIATVLIIGLCVDYGIFMVSHAGGETDPATSRAVLVSGLTTIAGFGVLAWWRHAPGAAVAGADGAARFRRRRAGRPFRHPRLAPKGGAMRRSLARAIAEHRAAARRLRHGPAARYATRWRPRRGWPHRPLGLEYQAGGAHRTGRRMQFPVQGLLNWTPPPGSVRLAALDDFGVTLFRLTITRSGRTGRRPSSPACGARAADGRPLRRLGRPSPRRDLPRAGWTAAAAAPGGTGVRFAPGPDGNVASASPAEAAAGGFGMMRTAMRAACLSRG